MTEEQKTEFLTRLRDLLEEYNAEIFCDLEGDLYGIHKQDIVLTANREEVLRVWNPPYLEASSINEHFNFKGG